MSAVFVLVILGTAFAFLLYVVAKAFFVAPNEKVEALTNALPGGNCGACGFAGCHDFAVHLAEGKVEISGCPVCTDEHRIQLASILGIESCDMEKMVAFRHCNGTNEIVKRKAEYHGIKDCLAASQLQGGDKACLYGCLGYGDCFRACPFGAITMGEDGLPHINVNLCTGCGECVKACPKDILELVPIKQKVFVACSSHDFGKDVITVCKVGCIACGKCERECPVGAIKVVDKLAVIDYSKCINCGKCVKVCPTGAIVMKK